MSIRESNECLPQRFERQLGRSEVRPGGFRELLARADIGAHVGKYSLRIAKVVKNSKVIAVEADAKSFRALQTGVKLNGLKNLVALNLAAWNTNEILKPHLAAQRGWHSMKKDMNLGYVVVKGEPLDKTLKRLDIDIVNWTKIDLEDSETEVLQGLRGTIRRCNPLIILESRS